MNKFNIGDVVHDKHHFGVVVSSDRVFDGPYCWWKGWKYPEGGAYSHQYNSECTRITDQADIDRVKEAYVKFLIAERVTPDL